MKRTIEPDLSASAGFGILLIIVTQIVAVYYFVSTGAVETEREFYGTYETETIVYNTPLIFTAISISLSGWLSGLVLVALSKSRQELECIRKVLNEEYGRVQSAEATTSTKGEQSENESAQSELES